MALWQFTVALLPQSWIDAGGDTESLLEEGSFDLAPAWRGHSGDRLQQSLDAILPRGRPWSADLVLWGKVDADDIQLLRHRSHVESVLIRFDLRNPNMMLFRQVVEIAQEQGLAILAVESKRVLTPRADQLVRAAAESSAAHFVIDPESFLLQARTANERAT